MKHKKAMELLRILAALGRINGRAGGFRLSEVSQFASFSRMTTYRTLQNLCELGAVSKREIIWRGEKTAHYSITLVGLNDWLGEGF